MEVFNLQTDAFAAYLQSYEPNYFSDLEIWKLENFRMGIRREFGDTVESRFKKAWFKKESRFKNDFCYNRFFST